MDRARTLRRIGELLSSPIAMRDAWPECAEALASLLDGERAQIISAEGSATSIARDDGICTIVVPLYFHGELLGALRIEGARRADDDSIALLEACALNIAGRLHFERFTQSSERLAELARIDPLTGIANRRRFDEAFAEACEQAKAQGTPLAVAVIDIDYFKAYNDAYGHQRGDAALRAIAAALKSCARRPDDLVARYGGEEFVLLLPGAPYEAALAACEHARNAVAQLELAHPSTSLGRVSISIGFATFDATRDAEAFFHDADDQLYRAKLDGRNRISGEEYASSDASTQLLVPMGGSNLPEPPNKLIGRVRQLRELATRIPQHRLVTISGVGGAGKTRLAIEAASRALAQFEDGVWFVDFSAVADRMLVPAAVGALFERAQGGTSKELFAAIGHKHALLVFDNCEHLLPAIAQLVSEILLSCPRAHVLATSREALGLPAESTFALRPLDVPPPDLALELDDVLSYEAVALLNERVRDANHEFVPDARSAALAASIARRLDGIPLALELAAPRAATIGFEALDADLERQPTMRSVIAWSYALLSDDEARIFRRLAVFNGGFRHDAAVDVCWDPQIAPPEVSTIVERLLRKSLIVLDRGEPDARYRMLETIREFALAQLSSSGEFDELRRRHVRWVLDFANKHDFSKRSVRTHLTNMTPELDNFRAAVAWALDVEGDHLLGCELVAALLPFVHDVAMSEGTRWALRALEVLPAGSDPAIEADICYSLSILRQLPAARLRYYAERALSLRRTLGDPLKLAHVLRSLAQLIGWYFREEHEYADELAIEAIAIMREFGGPFDLVNTLRTRGLTIDISDFPAKRAVLEEALAIARTHKLDRAIGGTLTWISEMEFSAGDYRRAYEYGQEALQLAEAIGSRDLYLTAAINFANYAYTAGEYDDAHAAATSALRVARGSSHEMSITFSVQALAAAAAGRGQFERAARLIGFCDARNGKLHPPPQADQSEDLIHRALIAKLRDELGEERLQHLVAEGRSLGEDEAAREAVAP